MSSHPRIRSLVVAIPLALAALLGTRAEAYTLFESDPVRPIAASPDGSALAVANTPEGTVDLFDITPAGLRPLGSVPVGVEPVAVAWNGDGELWVVNHVSDSVSIVDFDPRVRHNRRRPAGGVVRTLHVGDEPRDIVITGGRAYITTAHRGQAGPDPQLGTPGIGRADVWVFPVAGERVSMAGIPLTIITLFTDTPRALAVSPDGGTVYAAGFRTGNRTTTVVDRVAVDADGLLPPFADAGGAPQLPTGLIVGHDGEHWRSADGRIWDAQVKFDLPDRDVFAIDARAVIPRAVPGHAWAGVGTVLYGMAVHPRSGEIFVANTDANNRTRFEGVGALGHGTLRGDLHRARISILGRGGAVRTRWLNPHLADAGSPKPADRDASLATPMSPVFSADGERLYVAGFGSSALGVYDVAELRAGHHGPARQIAVLGGGPSGIVLDERRGRAYVTTRFDNAVSIIDLRAGAEVDKLFLANPEPLAIREGRPFLYDARLTSANGEASCAGCHVFGDTDHLAWDLGDPDLVNVPDRNPRVPLIVRPPIPFTDGYFQALKGPMTTQSLRGMANHGPMHWRGDRTGADDAPSVQPDSGAYDERAAFAAFDGAFVSLLGRDEMLDDAQMAALTDFALALTYPPNPIRRLDDRDTFVQARGREVYFGAVTDGVSNCNGCHTLDPDGNAEHGVERPGFFGTDGRSSFDGIFQVMKIPHLRNAYQKVGMFGVPANDAVLPLQPDHGQHLGAQVRGFGFAHDGAVDTLYRFFSALQFAPRPAGTIAPDDPGNPGLGIDIQGLFDRVALADFVLAFPSNLAPIVGHQITMDWSNRLMALPRLWLMVEQADHGRCDLVAHARMRRRMRGALYVGGGQMQLDDGGLARISAVLWIDRVTFTCVPPGEGDRYAFDRLH